METKFTQQSRPSSTVQQAPVMLCRNKVATGHEWWLEVAGERVGDVGIFGAYTPAQAFAMLIRRESR